MQEDSLQKKNTISILPSNYASIMNPKELKVETHLDISSS